MKYPLLSEDATRVNGQLACAFCEGTQFQARRSIAARKWIVVGVIMAGVPGFLVWVFTSQKYVECITCGLIYRRD